MNRRLFAVGVVFFLINVTVAGGYECVSALYLCYNVYTCALEYTQKVVTSFVIACGCVCVCVSQSPDIPVKTHTFLNQHVGWVFIASALMSPWKPMMGGQCLKRSRSLISCFLGILDGDRSRTCSVDTSQIKTDSGHLILVTDQLFLEAGGFSVFFLFFSVLKPVADISVAPSSTFCSVLGQLIQTFHMCQSFHVVFGRVGTCSGGGGRF